MMAGADGAAPVTGACSGIISEFSRCLGYLEHIGKVAKDSLQLMDSMEGTMSGKIMGSMEGAKRGFNTDSMEGTMGGHSMYIVEGTRDWSSEKSQMNFVASLVEKVMEDYRKEIEPKVKKKCNFYNRGFCRQGILCEFEHPVDICDQYLKEGECSQKHCNGRHIYKCRYFQNSQGCFRGNSCEFLHQVIESASVKNDLATNNHEENAEIVEDISCIEVSNPMTKDTFGKDTTSIIPEETEENEDNLDQDTFVKKEVRKVNDKPVEDEENGYRMLEEAIDAGIDLDNDLLDRILEVMDKQVSKGDEEEKKKKGKKTRKKVTFSAGKGVSH